MKDLLDIMKGPADNGVKEFDSIQISLASPEAIKSWSHGEVKSQKPLTTAPLNLSVMVYSVPKFLVLSKTLSVCAANINAVNFKASFVSVAVLK